MVHGRLLPGEETLRVYHTHPDKKGASEALPGHAQIMNRLAVRFPQIGDTIHLHPRWW